MSLIPFAPFAELLEI